MPADLPSWLAGARETIEAAASAQTEEEHWVSKVALQILAVNSLPALCNVVEALQEMVATQEEWERAVAQVIQSEPGVFPRAIDRARAALLALVSVPRG